MLIEHSKQDVPLMYVIAPSYTTLKSDIDLLLQHVNLNPSFCLTFASDVIPRIMWFACL